GLQSHACFEPYGAGEGPDIGGSRQPRLRQAQVSGLAFTSLLFDADRPSNASTDLAGHLRVAILSVARSLDAVPAALRPCCTPTTSLLFWEACGLGSRWEAAL